MDWTHKLAQRTAMVAAALIIGGCASMGGNQPLTVKMTGAQEVPPVNTAASGTGTITVGEDRSVSGRIMTQGVNGVAAHIHEAAAGQNGPVIVPMDKTGENEWSTKPGAKLTDAQFEAYKAGRLYFNVHSPTNKGGEIRGQIQPAAGGSSRSMGSSY
jgi:hypothetical protein